MHFLDKVVNVWPFLDFLGVNHKSFSYCHCTKRVEYDSSRPKIECFINVSYNHLINLSSFLLNIFSIFFISLLTEVPKLRLL